HSGAGPARLGVVAAVVDLEFLHRVLAERVWITRAGATGGLPEEQIVAIRAVDQDTVERAALSGEGQIAAAGVPHHAGRAHGDIEKVASIDGKIGDRLFVHYVAGLRPCRLDDGHVGGHADHFLSGADGKLHVDGRYRAHAERDIGTLGDLETFLLDRQGIGSDGQPDQAVEPGV